MGTFITSSKDFQRLLSRGVAEVIVEKELRKLLGSGKKLRLKEGFDPSFPDIHLGHMVALKKLRQFQDLGHQVVLIVGDWTARIGDPSGASVTRPMLSEKEVKANANTYMEQFFKIVDKDRTEVRWQSEWYRKFTLADVIQLTSRFTIAQLLARDDFSKRYGAGNPISMTEFLYPLLQAYDSVAVQADVEFGGTDQKFNLLVGRELQSAVGQRPQQVFLVPILAGTDGSQKMSKSLDNYIGVAEPAEDIYGKAMSIPDNIMMDYFELVTDVPDKELALFRLEMANNSINPMDLKKRLAREIVIQLYDNKTVTKAEEHFVKIIQNKGLPEEIPVYSLSFLKDAAPASCWDEDKKTGIKIYGIDGWDISKIIVITGQAKSRADANRLITQGAVEIDGEKITNNIAPIKSGGIIKVGKRRFAKIINSDIIQQSK